MVRLHPVCGSVLTTFDVRRCGDLAGRDAAVLTQVFLITDLRLHFLSRAQHAVVVGGAPVAPSVAHCEETSGVLVCRHSR